MEPTDSNHDIDIMEQLLRAINLHLSPTEKAFHKDIIKEAKAYVHNKRKKIELNGIGGGDE